MARNIKGIIKLRLSTGETVTYVNPNVQDLHGKNSVYYSYTNEPGDTFEDQTEVGQAKTDYDFFVSKIKTDAVLTYPETGTELVTKNSQNNVGSVAKIRRVIHASSLVEVIYVETEISEFAQLELDRGIIY